MTKELEGEMIDRAKLEDLLKQKFFYDMSFSIYGGERFCNICIKSQVWYGCNDGGAAAVCLMNKCN